MSNEKDWIVIEDPLIKRIEELEKKYNELKLLFDDLNNNRTLLKKEVEELKKNQLWKSNKFTDADLLKMDYLRSRNTCIRTKSTAKFMPEIS